MLTAARGRSQANACWEALASEEEQCAAPQEEFNAMSRFGMAAAAATASKHSAEDFKQLKVLLRLLEERIQKETPPVRMPAL